MTGSPLGNRDMLRTMSPPPGIAQLWNFSVAGSKRTIVFGLAPQSLYHPARLLKSMPKGSDFGPLGNGHSFTAPVTRSSLPMNPRAKSAYQIMPSGPMARRRGRAAASGNGYSLIASVFGSMVAILLLPNSTSTGTP